MISSSWSKSIGCRLRFDETMDAVSFSLSFALTEVLRVVVDLLLLVPLSRCMGSGFGPFAEVSMMEDG